MGATHHIYLVPGFFGFVNFGKLIYFSHVREYLEEAFGERGLPVELHRVRVSPTASIRQRAAELALAIAETSARGPIHLIGHSTGGLDARLFVTPGVSLEVDAPVEEMARRVATITTVSTPHHGTPLASSFTGVVGQRMLALLSLATALILREGRLPITVMARLGAGLGRVLLPDGKALAVLEHLEAELMGRLPPGDRDEVAIYLSAIGRDRALLPQLMPAGVDLFNAACAPRGGVRYGSVVARARPPRLLGHLRAGGPWNQATYALYRVMHGRTGGAPTRGPVLDDAQRAALLEGFGALPGSDDSDGVVPTLSQIHGAVLAAVTADHLDVIGHFDCERHQPPHHDWIVSGSNFDRPAFEALWSAVAGFVAPEVRRRRFGWRRTAGAPPAS